jgi:hypothetical protein
MENSIGYKRRKSVLRENHATMEKKIRKFKDILNTVYGLIARPMHDTFFPLPVSMSPQDS